MHGSMHVSGWNRTYRVTSVSAAVATRPSSESRSSGGHRSPDARPRASRRHHGRQYPRYLIEMIVVIPSFLYSALASGFQLPWLNDVNEQHRMTALKIVAEGMARGMMMG